MKAIPLFILLVIIWLLLDSNRAFSQHSEWNLPSYRLTFASGSARITVEARQALSELRDRMQANPDFKVVVEGSSTRDYAVQKLSWARVYAVIRYMSDANNIDQNRFIFKYQGIGQVSVVVCRQPNDGEEGPSMVDPPRHYRRR